MKVLLGFGALLAFVAFFEMAGGCTYNGVNYSTGQKWEDGCLFKCECVDAVHGIYKCTERCPTYSAVPEECTLDTTLVDRCCKIPKCPENKT